MYRFELHGLHMVSLTLVCKKVDLGYNEFNCYIMLSRS